MVCPRCRWSTHSRSQYKRHLFNRKSPCVPHHEGYTGTNYQPMQMLIDEFVRLEKMKQRPARARDRVKRSIAAMNVEHWSSKMVPQDMLNRFEGAKRSIQMVRDELSK